MRLLKLLNLWPPYGRVEDDGEPLDLGRFRVGEFVRFALNAETDAAPVGNLYDEDGHLIGRVQMSPAVGGGMVGSVFLTGSFSLGEYEVSLPYYVNGVVSLTRYTFRVVAGGDSGGNVLSLYSARRPDCTRVLAHLASGRIVQGNRPRT